MTRSAAVTRSRRACSVSAPAGARGPRPARTGEERGFIGLAAILMVYLMLAMRGMRSALAVRDTFGKLLGGGLSFSIVMQIFVVVGGGTNLIPETGITPPFPSQGGAS